MRNIHRLPATPRTLARTWSASVWNASAVVRGGEGAAQRVARPAGGLLGPEHPHRLVEPPGEQPLDAGVRDAAVGRQFRPGRQVEPVDRVQEEQRPHAVVQVAALAAEPVEGVALGEQLRGSAGRRQAAASGRLRTAGSVERMMSVSGIGLAEFLPGTAAVPAALA